MMRTVTFAPVARPVRFTTVPDSVPAVAPALSELSVPTDTPGAARAGAAVSAPRATVNNAAPVARTLRPSMSCNPPRAGARAPKTQERAPSPDASRVRGARRGHYRPDRRPDGS